MSSDSIDTGTGARLFYRSWGAGRPIVFVHGWAVSADVWQYPMASLSQHVRCIAYDKRGHGRSSDPGQDYDYDGLAKDLAALLDQLDLRNVVLVGHSMGPPEIVRYLTRHGKARVAKLVFISPALPTLIIHGAQDKSAPLDLTSQRLVTMIRGSQLKIYDGAPHGLLLTHQDRLNQDLLGWVST
jgi:pimeloyl-ACP methyl ester carboxylesterase